MKEILKTIANHSGVFVEFNANPNNNNTTDCVVRAIAVATEREWEDVMRDIFEFGMKHKLVFNDPDCYAMYLKELGFTKQKQPKKKNGKKYRAYEWAPKFKGIAVAHVGSHHMVAIRNGKVIDSWDSTEGIVGNYWTK